MGRYDHAFMTTEHSVERRGRRRMKSFLSIEVISVDVISRGHILDLSDVGARCHAHVPPHARADVTLVWNAIRISGHVTWVKGNGFGVLFHPHLKPEQMAILLGA